MLSLKWQKNKKNLSLLLLSLPALLFLLIFNYAPMSGVIMAFMKIRYDRPIYMNEIIGFKNFEFLFTSSDAIRITRNTILLNGAFIICGTVLALILAILLNEVASRKRVKMYQTIMFFPYFLSWVVVSYILYALIAEKLGIINVLLTSLGADPIKWYTNPSYWPYIFIIANTWKYTGYSSIVYYGGIMGIDPEYYDAASIDGASKWQMITKITIPSITPLIVIMTLFSIGRIMYADFGMFYFLPRNIGMLYSATDVIDTYVYRALSVTGDFGLASAAALFQSFFGFLLILLTNVAIKKFNPDYGLF